MRKKLYLISFFLLASGYFSFGQLVGGNAYLQGRFLEIGELNIGAFGAYPTPGGYHNHCPSCCNTTALAEVYNVAHSAWGAPVTTYFGDYTFPGTPFEGWEIQVNGVRSQAMQSFGCSSPGAYSGGTLGGSVTSYSNIGGRALGNWVGTCAGLNMYQETRVDTQASWVVVTTRFYNNTLAPINSIYYLRTTDPDNEHEQSGIFTTTNMVVKQVDADQRVLVNSKGTTYANAYLALGAKDCRARCLWYSNWPTSIASDLATVWTSGGALGTSGFTVGSTITNDWAIGIVYNLGNLAAGDSTFISYAYIFDGDNGIDSAFPDPGVRMGSGPIVNPPAPWPHVVIDTYNECLNPSVPLVPVDLLYAEDKEWTWSTWTWSPGTGLSATTGAHVLVTTTSLPPVITYTVTGVNPTTCAAETMLLTFITCDSVRSNSPCDGDTLFLRRLGDSTNCTYYWYGPPGFSATGQAPYVYPATAADSAMFYVVRIYMGTHRDTDSIPVFVHYKPVITVSNNGPLCAGMTDTLQLTDTTGIAGMTFSWTGPGGFTSSLQNPTIPGYVGADTGVYTLVVTTGYGCKDTAKTDAGIIRQPPYPRITDQNYCQGQTFIPFHLDSLVPGSTVLWWSAGTGGTSTTTTSTVSTATPGIFFVWASQIVGSCESLRGEDSVTVFPTPLAPVVMGNTQYCQFAPFDTVVVVPTSPTDSIKWYTVPTGGVGVSPEPYPNLSVVPPGRIYKYWVSLKLSEGCEGPRTEVDITVHPKPAMPTDSTKIYCQFEVPGYLVAVPDTIDAAELLTWYGPTVPPPGYTPLPSTGSTSTVIQPPTSTAPDTLLFYVSGTSRYGCVSDKAPNTVIIKAQPAPPITHDSRYCQGAPNVVPLNWQVDSLWNSQHLSWYLNTTPISVPTPIVSGAPGYASWYVSQWVNNCQSDSAKVTVQVVYLPKFGICASSPWVCQFDSLNLSYCNGPSLFEALYSWTLPEGALPVGLSNVADSAIKVQFDSANQNFFVVGLRASDDSGFCFSDTTIQIKVIPQPAMGIYTKPDVCLGDTVQLSLNMRSNDAYNYTWYIDYATLFASGAVHIVSSNSNSGGPYTISWIDTGKHVITVRSSTIEGCASKPILDSVDVHSVPDATFKIAPNSLTNTICIEDSVLFNANTVNYNNSYEWTPTDYFNNENKPNIWGRLRSAKDIVSLKVTDPYGCYATSNLEIDPQTCCTLLFPNAFTPDAVGAAGSQDRIFQPISTGYHQFHQFRIVNRWGQTVFESANNSDARWDGTFNGVPQDMGTYYYFVKYDCGGATFEQKGDVTLIR